MNYLYMGVEPCQESLLLGHSLSFKVCFVAGNTSFWDELSVPSLVRSI